MIKRIGLLMMAALVAVMMLAASATAALAAPVTCEGEGLTLVKTGPGTWECQNKPAQGNPPEKSKNPNR